MLGGSFISADIQWNEQTVFQQSTFLGDSHRRLSLGCHGGPVVQSRGEYDQGGGDRQELRKAKEQRH